MPKKERGREERRDKWVEKEGPKERVKDRVREGECASRGLSEGPVNESSFSLSIWIIPEEDTSPGHFFLPFPPFLCLSTSH